MINQKNNKSDAEKIKCMMQEMVRLCIPEGIYQRSIGYLDGLNAGFESGYSAGYEATMKTVSLAQSKTDNIKEK